MYFANSSDGTHVAMENCQSQIDGELEQMH